MKKNRLLGLIGICSLLMFIGGCSKNNGKMTTSQNANTELLQEDNDQTNSQNIETIDESNTDIDTNENQSTNEGIVTKENTYTWQEITVTIPESWKDKYVVRSFEDGFYFYQKSSYEINEDMGFLCYYYRSKIDTIDGLEATPLSYSDDTLYSVSYPTDVSYYYENEKIANEYKQMENDLPLMEKSIQIEKENIHYNPSEYILPMSSTKLYSIDYLTCFNTNQLWVARNEIFARHGRQFENVYLQQYFDSCSWYEGTSKNDKFDDSVLNTIEKENLKAIKSAEQELEKNQSYPKKYKIGQQIKVDLDGDGKKNVLEYQLKKGDSETDYKAYIIIDGTTFDIEDFDISHITPEESGFYITDLADFKAGLEIAILDYGRSDDLATHFFTYNGKLERIGTISGFPFKEYGGFDGFTNPLTVTGTIRADIIHTCYAQADWRYDVENNKLEFQDNGYYPIVEKSHELYVDLPVYYEMSEDSTTSVIKAQKEVFFVATDGKEWIEVKGKDGTKGYMHVKDRKILPLNREATEVFSNLDFFD
ncbi:YARHG domain-containing protein [Anaerosporobacter sp.]